MARVPSRNGAYLSSISSSTSTCPSGVISKSFTRPAWVPPTSTRLPFTSCPAFTKRALTL